MTWRKCSCFFGSKLRKSRSALRRRSFCSGLKERNFFQSSGRKRGRSVSFPLGRFFLGISSDGGSAGAANDNAIRPSKASAKEERRKPDMLPHPRSGTHGLVAEQVGRSQFVK